MSDFDGIRAPKLRKRIELDRDAVLGFEGGMQTKKEIKTSCWRARKQTWLLNEGFSNDPLENLKIAFLALFYFLSYIPNIFHNLNRKRMVTINFKIF